MNQTIDVKQLHPMLHRDHPVCTTEMLAQLYGTDTHNLRMNFKNNRARFEEGKHFVTLKGAELQEFKRQVNNIDLPFAPSKLASHVSLWTERGAARHAKLLDTDKAWEVYEELEDCYFHAKAQAAPQQPAPLTVPLVDHLALAGEAGELRDENAALKAELLDLYRDKTPARRVRVEVVEKVPVAAIELMLRYGVPREEVAAVSGRSRDCLRVHIHHARKAGRLQ